jgi:hypothetical protein
MIRACSTPLGRRCRFSVLSLAVAGVLGSSASAATTSTWIGANGGSWSISTNWNPNGMPLGAAGGGTNVLFSPASGSYVENGSYSTAAPLGIFTFGAAGAASGPTLTESANTLATTDEIFDTGTFAQSGGTNSVSGTLTMGNVSGDNPNYNLTGGTLTAAKMIVAFEGSVTLTQSGTSTINLGSGELQLGFGFGTSTASFSGGTLNAGIIFNNGNLLQSGTSNMSLGSFDVDSSGVASLSGGILNATSIIANGTLAQSGTNNINLGTGSLDVGNSAISTGAGTANFSGGTLNASGGQVIVGNGNAGTLLQSGTSNIILGTGSFVIGDNTGFGGNGTANLSGGTLSAPGGQIIVGYNGSGSGAGTLLQSGTSDISLGTGSLIIGDGTGSTGTGSFSGGTLSAGQIIVGYSHGGGTLLQSGTNDINLGAGTLLLGDGTGSTGVASFSGGTLSAGQIIVGLSGGAGSLLPSSTSDITIGTLTIGDGTGSTGAGSMSGGSFSAENTLIGLNGGVGTFLQSAGSSSLGALFVAYTAPGEVGLSGGSLTASSTAVGDSGSGTFQQSGGSSNLGVCNIGGISPGYVLLTAGSLTAGPTLVGVFGNGSFIQGGSQSFSKLGAVHVGSTGTIQLSGGTMDVQSISSAGALNITGGTLAIIGAGSLGSGSIAAPGLSISGVLDVGSSGIVIEYGNGTSPIGDLSFAHTARNYPTGSIQRYAQTGINGLNWNGPGIISSDAENDSSGLTAVGVADENDLANVYPANYTVADNGSGTWMGQPINDPNNVLVRYTWYGDGNLDGVVNKFDVAALAQGYSGLAGYIGWSDGDYTYAGYISKLDISLLAESYVFQGAPLGDAITDGQAQYLLALDPEMPGNVQAEFQSISGTPEPASLAVLCAAGVGLLSRRRRTCLALLRAGRDQE